MSGRTSWRRLLAEYYAPAFAKFHPGAGRGSPIWRLRWGVDVRQAFRMANKSKKSSRSSRKSPKWGDATLAIHTGEEHFRVGEGVGASIARTATFTFASTEEMKRWAEGKS